MFEILVPLALIVVLLMCMMNNNTEEYFKVGGDAHEGEAKCHHNTDEGFKVGGEAHEGEAKSNNLDKGYNSVRSTVEGEILYSSCDDSEYGPVRLDSVDRNLSGVGNAPENVLGYGDCTDLEFAPVKFSTGGPQVPSMNSLKPSLSQLPAPPIDGVQGITRPASFNSVQGPKPNGNKKGNGANKKAQVTMVRADWCGFCKKAMPEWEKLKSEIHNKVVNGYHIVLRDLEQKRDEEEIKKNYSDVNGFPTYVVETTDASGKLVKAGTFNSIEKDDMHEKIKQHLN